MTDAIGPRHSPLSWPDPQEYHVEQLQAKALSERKEGAEAIAASYWYQSSIQPAQPALSATTEKNAKSIAAAAEEKKSVFSQIKDWFYNLIGVANAKNETAETEESTAQPAPQQDISTSINHPPHLTPPENTAAQYAKSVNGLNKELMQRTEDEIERLREIFRTSNFEVLLQKYYIACAQVQRQIKEQGGIEIQEEVRNRLGANKKLQSTYYSLLEEITERAKTNKNLHWVNLGLTLATVASLALTYATGGAWLIVQLATPLLGIAKAGTTLSEGVLKHKNDKQTGDLTMVTFQLKRNSSTIQQDLLPELQNDVEIIGDIHKGMYDQNNAQQKVSTQFSRFGKK